MALDTVVNRKQMHTDRYWHFNSHHPVSAKRAAVRSLFDRARNVTLRNENLPKEKEHLTATFINNTTRGGARRARERRDTRRKRRSSYWQVIPYASGVSERIRKASEKYNLKMVFKSGPTLHSLLTKLKDPMRQGCSIGLPGLSS